ncbi:immunoglobulin-like domain-containing protein [Listeria costaricensis]|uniref:immunoglobulin-like domain-containing protein n=1 Tax=Listeria costaricensis TaxID=2026604 RepID=UPI000C06FE5D|nr:immunoglobulin-like domain-containing protein [Listeria costaricensis]
MFKKVLAVCSIGMLSFTTFAFAEDVLPATQMETSEQTTETADDTEKNSTDGDSTATEESSTSTESEETTDSAEVDTTTSNESTNSAEVIEESQAETATTQQEQPLTATTTLSIEELTDGTHNDEIVDASLFENQTWLINVATSYVGKPLAQITYGDLAKITMIQAHIDYGKTEYIPKAIGLFTGLTSLQAVSNCEGSGYGYGVLTGEIPAEIGNLKNLTSLRIFDNELYGAVPEEIGNCTELQRLDISGNGMNTTLSGYDGTGIDSLPHSIGNLKKLDTLIVGNYNYITEIPAEIGECESLKYLDISQMELEYLPPELGSCPKLQTLYAGYNAIRGTIPDSYANLRDTLETFQVQCNGIHGEVPDYLLNGEVSNVNIYSNFLYDIATDTYPASGSLNFFNANDIVTKNSSATKLADAQYDLTSIQDEVALEQGETYNIENNLRTYNKEYLDVDAYVVSGDPDGVKFTKGTDENGNSTTNMQILKSGTYELNVQLEGLKDKSNQNAQTNFTVTGEGLPNEKPAITLDPEQVKVKQDSTFNYSDYTTVTLSDDQDSAEDLAAALQVTGDVDTTKPGETYTLDFNVTDSLGLAADQKTLSVYVDARPSIELTTEEVSISEGETFDPMRYLKTDSDLEDATDSLTVTTSGTVDTSTPGQTTITYTVTDSMGQTDTATLIVNVTADAEPADDGDTNDDQNNADSTPSDSPSGTPTGNNDVTTGGNTSANTASKSNTALPQTGDQSSKAWPLIGVGMGLTAAFLWRKRK